MMQEHFGLEQIPFLLSPAIDSFFETDAVRGTRERLEQSARKGGGVAVLTAPSGTGKTSLLYQIAGHLTPEFRVVSLKSLAFESVGDLLKGILFELDIPYRKLGEQDLRLRLLQAGKKLRGMHKGIVILADEAHLSSPPILQELRSLTNFVDGNEPLFRVIVAGQLELEEQFASRELASFVQRISCQETLERLTQQESFDYIDSLIHAAGGDAELVMSEEAMHLIAHAADGLPRNLNHLCDHAMSLATANGEKPVGEDTVRDALQDLQKLPMHWRIPAGIDSNAEQTSTAFEDYSTGDPITGNKSVVEVGDAESSIEFGTDDANNFDASPEPANEKVAASIIETVEDDEGGFSIEIGADCDSETTACNQEESPVKSAEDVVATHDDVAECEAEVADAGPQELDIEDRYAALDYQSQLQRRTHDASPVAKIPEPHVSTSKTVEPKPVEVAIDARDIAGGTDVVEADVEADIQKTIVELTEAASHLISGQSTDEPDIEDSEEAISVRSFDIVLPED